MKGTSVYINPELIHEAEVIFGRRIEKRKRWTIRSVHNNNNRILVFEVVLNVGSKRDLLRKFTLNADYLPESDFDEKTRTLRWRYGKFFVNLVLPDPEYQKSIIAFDA